jgi:hypothetical protein
MQLLGSLALSGGDVLERGVIHVRGNDHRAESAPGPRPHGRDVARGRHQAAKTQVAEANQGAPEVDPFDLLVDRPDQGATPVEHGRVVADSHGHPGHGATQDAREHGDALPLVHGPRAAT